MIGVGATRPRPSSARAGVGGCAAAVAAAPAAARRPTGHRALLEDVARAHDEPGAAGQADEPDRHDAVAAEAEEVVMDADPPQPERLREQRRQRVLGGRARLVGAGQGR